MSEKLIDHEFTNDCPYDDCPVPERCHYRGLGKVDPVLGCGQPRSRHRQAEKAQDAAADLDDAMESVLPNNPPHQLREAKPADPELAKLPAPLSTIAALAACQGAPDPQPGELARLRSKVRGLDARACEWKQEAEHRGSDLAQALKQLEVSEERATKAEANLADAVTILEAWKPSVLSWCQRHPQAPQPKAVAAFERLKKEKVIE